MASYELCSPTRSIPDSKKRMQGVSRHRTSSIMKRRGDWKEREREREEIQRSSQIIKQTCQELRMHHDQALQNFPSLHSRHPIQILNLGKAWFAISRNWLLGSLWQGSLQQNQRQCKTRLFQDSELVFTLCWGVGTSERTRRTTWVTFISALSSVHRVSLILQSTWYPTVAEVCEEKWVNCALCGCATWDSM